MFAMCVHVLEASVNVHWHVQVNRVTRHKGPFVGKFLGVDLPTIMLVGQNNSGFGAECTTM
jgi:hypothetical protein